MKERTSTFAELENDHLKNKHFSLYSKQTAQNDISVIGFAFV
jgi:hypothetical protein